MPTPIRELPSTYSETYRLRITDGSLLLWLNLLSLVPMAVAFALMAAWMSAAAGVRAALGWADAGVVDVPWVIGFLLAMLITLPAHELIHGLVITAVGHRARYGIKWDKGVLYATADNALFRRAEYLAVALAPLIGLTAVALIGMVVLPSWLHYWLALGAILNAGGAIGDLWMVWVLRRFPASALVRDVEDGFIVYQHSEDTA